MGTGLGQGKIGLHDIYPPQTNFGARYCFYTSSCSPGGGGVVGLHPGVGRRGLGRPPPRILWDTVNERAVRILLEYILVCAIFQTTNSAVLVSDSLLWHCISPGPGPILGPVKVLSD